jgi:chemotaxis signal transduction protein
MMETGSDLARRAADLRREFDRGFAEPPLVEDFAKQDLLAFRLDEQHFALRLAEIAGLFVDKKITPVPGAGEFLLGVAGFRGAIAPVYDLGCLLGLPPGPVSRWLVIAAAAPVGFAFTAFTGRLRVGAAAIAPEHRDDTRSLTSGVVHASGILRPIIEIARALEAVQT